MAAAAAVAASRAAGTERMREHLTADRISIFSFELNKDDFDPSLEKQIAFVNNSIKLFELLEENKIKAKSIDTLVNLEKKLQDKVRELNIIQENPSLTSKVKIDINIIVGCILFMNAYLNFRYGVTHDTIGFITFDTNKELPRSPILH